MIIKEILDNFTKDSLLSELFELYPDQKPSRTGYNYVIDKLKSKEVKETELVLHIDMKIKDGKDAYEVYALDSQDNRKRLSRMEWDEFVSLEIDEDIIEYMDEKVILGHAVYYLTYDGFTDRNDGQGLDLFEALGDAFMNPDNWIPVPIDPSELGGLFSELKRLADEFMDKFIIEEVGEIDIESDKVILNDASNVSDKVIIENVKPGKWIVSTVDCTEEMQEGDPKDYIELTLKHEDLREEDIYELTSDNNIKIYEKKLDAPTKKVVAMDFSHYDELTVYSEEADEPNLLPNGIIMPCGLDDGPYAIHIHTNEDGVIVAIRVLLVEDEDEEEYPDME